MNQTLLQTRGISSGSNDLRTTAVAAAVAVAEKRRRDCDDRDRHDEDEIHCENEYDCETDCEIGCEEIGCDRAVVVAVAAVVAVARELEPSAGLPGVSNREARSVVEAEIGNDSNETDVDSENDCESDCGSLTVDQNEFRWPESAWGGKGRKNEPPKKKQKKEKGENLVVIDEKGTTAVSTGREVREGTCCGFD